MIKIYRCAFVITALLFVITKGVSQQNTNPNLPKGYYIVVAAYFSNQESFAQRYSDQLNAGGLHTKYGLGPNRKLYFVYLDQYDDFDESVRQMLKVRKEGVFDRAWVRIIKEGGEKDAPLTTSKEEPAQHTNSVSAKVDATAPVQKVSEEAPKTVEEKKADSSPLVVTEVIENPIAKPVYLPQTLNNTQVFLSLYNAATNQVIDGEVEVVDTEKAKLITKVKGNTYLTLPNPGTKSGQLSLIADVFGFRKEQHEINYKNTETDTLKPYVALVGNYYMLNFGLARLHKGDISTLYNVYFYNDAAIMLPDSKYQLNSLLQLFSENPNLKAVLHGHTNGNSRGKIIYMGPSKDFFTLTKDVVQSSGTAKELSLARANVIREWLLAQGIADNRVTVKGWGGTRMIHDKNSVHARKNIRVDVEVIDE